VPGVARHRIQARGACRASSGCNQCGQPAINLKGTGMNRSIGLACALAGVTALATLLSFDAVAQVRVNYGRVTNVQAVTVTNEGARAAGAIVGGTLGVASGSGQSSSNRALRGVGGAVAGRAVGQAASNQQAFEYTVLIDGTQTTRIVSDQAGKRVGDCVAVEQGQFANIRLVPDSRCAPRQAAAAPTKAAPPPPAPAEDVQAASACDQAKAQVLAATTDEQFSIAERRMRLLCGE
jgi:outer membrane lipoprotein SlyB